MTTEPLTPEALDTIEARANAATEGPWEIVGGNEFLTGVGMPVGSPDGIPLADAEFIAASRDIIPALVVELRRLRTENEEQGTVIEQARQHNAQFEVDYIARMKRTHPHLSLGDIGFIETGDES